MSGYLFFNKTDVPEIDAISNELTNSGNAFHNTDMWIEETDWHPKSCVDAIQETLDMAAKELKQLRAELEQVKAERDELKNELDKFKHSMELARRDIEILREARKVSDADANRKFDV